MAEVRPPPGVLPADAASSRVWESGGQVLAPDRGDVLPSVAAPGGDGASEPGWPCLSCGATVPLRAAACGRCGAGFLAAASGARIVLPGLGDLMQRSRGQRMLLGLAVGLVLLVVLVAAMWAIGALL